LDIYDHSKMKGEDLALESAKKGSPIVVIRPGWVYGPGDKRTFKLIKAIAKKRFILVTQGNTCQTPVYIDDLIRGTLLCASEGRTGEVYNIAGKEVLKVKEVAQLTAKACGTKIPKFFLPLFPVKITAWGMGKIYKLFGKEAPLTMGRLAFFIHPKPLAIKKARKELNYQPQIDFQEGIKRSVHWYKENGWL